MSRMSARFLVALTAFWLATSPVLAADNAITLTAGAGVTERSKDVGVGVQSPVVINGDTSGNPLITAPGTPNASFALPVQGVTGGSPVPISAASLPLPAGAATATGLTTINTTLGTPFQAGGSIGNTGFNALQGGSANAVGNPFFVSPGTGASFTVTCAACATSANQTTANTSLATIATNTGAAVPAGTNIIGKVGIDQTTDGTTNGVRLTSQYPAGATPITASATGTTAATTATLAAAVGKTTYICRYSIRANATAATNVTDTVTGVVTATMSSGLWVAPAASGIGVDEQVYIPCVPASATNTAIAVVSGAPGTGGFVTVNASGYQQ